MCLSLFTRAPKTSEVVRLVSLEVVNNAVQTQQLDGASLAYLKDNLWEYTRRTYGGTDTAADLDSASLQNKLTQTFTFLFMSMYTQGWESFFDDFLSLAGIQNGSSQNHQPGAALYLRILSSIHDEIADTLVSRSSPEQKRNNDLKDLVRARDVHKLASSWSQVLSQWQSKSDHIVEMCLKVIGRWVSWIDISLVVNQEMLNLLFPLVGRTTSASGEDKVRDAAIDAFTEIVAKKMKPSDKIDMIVFLNITEVVAQLIASPALSEMRGTSNYDTDLAEAVAKLANITVFDVVKVLEDSNLDSGVRSRADQLLQTFLPLLLRFFSDEYDEICSTVIPSISDLLTFLRKSQPLSPQHSSMLLPILNAIITKMRYDETSSWGNEDELTDEAEFYELRKRLQILQKSVSAVDESLYTETLSNIVGNTFQRLDQQGGQMDWRDLDLALHEMYLFGELAVPNGGIFGKSQASTIAAERLSVMMTKMVESGKKSSYKQISRWKANISSGIASFNHPAIQLQYMEICVRYSSFFEANTNLIPQVLEHFVRLVHHNHVRVRPRSWYLFQRFVKHLRAQVGNITESVIQSISDLLPIAAEVPKEDAGDDDMSSQGSDHSADATFSSQLYLFEAIGSIASTGATPVEKQVLYARSILDPLFADMERHLPIAKSGDAQATLQVHHIIMALGTLAKGFSDWTPGSVSASSKAPGKEIMQEFSRAAEAILIALESLKSSFDVRTAARFSFSRLVGVIGSGILPQLPQWIDGLLSQKSSKDEMATFLRVLDQIVFGFKTEIYTVLDSLLTPLLQRVLSGLAEPAAGTDDEIQLGELRREYLTFIQIILNNDLGSVLVSESNQAFFEPLLTSIATLAKNHNVGQGSLAASRLAFSVLTRMAILWGGPDVVTPGPKSTPSTITPSPSFPGFDTFLIERFNPVCWEVLRDPQFVPGTDAQARSVVTEIATLEQTIYSKTGNLFIEHLMTSFFPSLGTDGSEFIQAMTMSEKKAFTNYILAFLKQRG